MEQAWTTLPLVGIDMSHCQGTTNGEAVPTAVLVGLNQAT